MVSIHGCYFRRINNGLSVTFYTSIHVKPLFLSLLNRVDCNITYQFWHERRHFGRTALKSEAICSLVENRSDQAEVFVMAKWAIIMLAYCPSI